MENPIKVVIADDSTIMRYMIEDLLSKDKGIDVVATANNGKDVIHKMEKYSPDVVVLDMNMGEYNGIYALERIMSERPTPTILLSAVGNTNMSKIMEGLKLGAVDYLNKPVKQNGNLKQVKYELIDKVKIAATSNLAAKYEELGRKIVKPHTFSEDLRYDAIVIGSSTGGPTAVEKVLTRLPENLAIPVVIAQHMPENFVPSFVKRLNTITPLKVEVGKLGTILRPQHVYVAPGGKNMIVKLNAEGRPELGFTKRVFKEFNNPSVNALMESACEVYSGRVIGVVLTGMGRDGTSGIKKIKENGGFTVAQSEKTSVVFGMPREAILSGKIEKVADLDEIGPMLVSCLS